MKAHLPFLHEVLFCNSSRLKHPFVSVSHNVTDIQKLLKFHPRFTMCATAICLSVLWVRARWSLDDGWSPSRRNGTVFLNGGAQDEAEPKTVPSLASSLEAGRTKSFLFEGLEATCSEVAHARNTTVGPVVSAAAT